MTIADLFCGDGDDFFCQPVDVSHWMPLPDWPNKPDSATKERSD